MRPGDAFALALDGARVAVRQARARLRPARLTLPPGRAGEDEVDRLCRAVALRCWNGRYLRAGSERLDQFWLRDLAIALDGLVDLGLGRLARASLAWALPRWERAGRVTTTIQPWGRPVDVWDTACDSLPWLLSALERLGADDLRARHRALLEAEARRYAREVVDPRTRRPRADRVLGGTKDTMTFRSTCFAWSMAAWTSALLARAGLGDPLDGPGIAGDLDRLFWVEPGGFYRNHLEPDRPGDPPGPLCSGDANFWPFWCGVARDPAAKLPRALAAVRAAGLDRPFPLKYHAQRIPPREVLVQRLFLPNYQGDAIWTFFTPQWLELLATVDAPAARAHAAAYDAWVLRHRTWVEVFEPTGQAPLVGLFGTASDRDMLWAAAWPRARRVVRAAG